MLQKWCGFARSVTIAKTVTIPDRRAGLFRFGIAVVIFFWTIFHDIVYQMGYVSFKAVQGEVTYRLKEPMLPSSCEVSNDTCRSDLTGAESLAYCCHSDCQDYETPEGVVHCNCPGREAKNRRCLYADVDRMGQMWERSFMLFTGNRRTLQQANESCYRLDESQKVLYDPTGSQRNCERRWSALKKEDFYFADPERFSIYVESTAVQPNLHFFARSRDIVGKLKIRGDSELQNEICRKYKGEPLTAPCVIKLPKATSGEDRLTVDMLLKAANVSLEEKTVRNKMRLLRSSGVSLVLMITYSNVAPLRPLGTVQYKYDVRVVHRKAHFQSEDWVERPGKRYLNNFGGLKVSFLVAGEVAYFDMTQLILRLVMYFTSLLILDFIIKAVATKMTRFHRHYSAGLEETMPDFKNLNMVELELMDFEEIEHLLRQRSLPRGGSAAQRLQRLLMDGWRPAPSCEMGRKGARLSAEGG